MKLKIYIDFLKYLLVLHWELKHNLCFSSYQCIYRSLQESNKCPKCNFIIDKQDQIFPNFLCKFYVVENLIIIVLCVIYVRPSVKLGVLP